METTTDALHDDNCTAVSLTGENLPYEFFSSFRDSCNELLDDPDVIWEGEILATVDHKVEKAENESVAVYIQNEDDTFDYCIGVDGWRKVL